MELKNSTPPNGRSARVVHNDYSAARTHALEMALRTPNVHDHHTVLDAARAYEDHIYGDAPPSPREHALEELVRSACAIADRQGEGTAWERFKESVHAVGLNGVTTRTYRLLPSDGEA